MSLTRSWQVSRPLPGDQRPRQPAVISRAFLDVVTGLPTLRAFGRSNAQLRAIARTTEDYRRATLATLRISFLSALVLELVATFSVALVAVSVGLRLVSGGLELRTALLVRRGRAAPAGGRRRGGSERRWCGPRGTGPTRRCAGRPAGPDGRCR